jgi:DNA helicase-2/ATP-dependent DNA helicase PcrA
VAFYADLHVHSKYSRATSRHCDLEHLALWARKKGITVVGTGDFTHPAWLAELKDKLIPAEPGLFRLRPDLERTVAERLPRACQGPARFMLSVEISTIYKKGEATRKIHHLIYTPDFATAEDINRRLGKIGNLGSDGRPILGLDSRHLLEIALDSGPGAYLVPAHIWTPWFAALGSKSGFDSIDLCYADLAPHIFAVETGLSSDPPMNWRVSSLDRFRLVSNSDAHSPEKLGREACVFTGDLDYFAIRRALETGQGYAGTVEFFPEEGKYHLDGHRACQVRLEPRETRAAGGTCAACGQTLTVGVMHRVEALADRMGDAPPATAGSVQSLVPLPEVLSELHQVGSKSKRVSHHYEQLLGQLGPELPLLAEVPVDDIRRVTSSLFAEAITRLREHRVTREAGYDGVYGTIRLFQADELRRHTVGRSLFADTTAPPAAPAETSSPAVPIVHNPAPHAGAIVQEAPANYLQDGETVPDLDAEQRRAVEAGPGPLLIVAGPGSGKTRTLTRRVAYLVRHRNVPAPHCLAITFTRRAADEMRSRLQTLLPDVRERLPIFTFHALGLSILRKHWNAAGLQRGFRIATAAQRLDVLRQALGVSETQARRWLAAISHAKRTRTAPDTARLAHACETYRRELALRNLVDYDDLVALAADLLESRPDLQASFRRRYPWVFIDEYQDVDEQQVRLIRQLAPADGNVCAIGDANQAIYGFRGADVHFFEQFQDDFPNAQVVRLKRNYRSQPHIVTLSAQLMGQSDFQPASVPGSASAPRRITLHEAASEAAEAEFVVRTVEQLLGGHSFFSIDSGRALEAATDDLSFADIAVLYRTEAQAPALVDALERSGMPFQHRSHRLLVDHPGVAALVDALLQRQSTGSVYEQLTAAVTAHGRDDEAEAVAPAADGLEALGLLQPLATACGDDLERFLGELALGTQVDTWDPRADRISVLTLHAAKGLEFPVVFIVGCEDGLLPLAWGQRRQEDLDEERRLFYVGMTRAKTRLYLCHARQRLWRGRVQVLAPSPFLDNLEEGFLDRQCFRPRSGRSRKPDAQLKLF